MKLADSLDDADSKPVLGRRKSTARSAISNGKDVLPGVDGRSVIARRFYDIQTAVVAEQGGGDLISEARLQLIRRFAASAVLAEEMEGRLARGEKIDISEHALLVSSLVRVANKIGIDRIPRQVLSSGEIEGSANLMSILRAGQRQP